ncbi:trans-sulfuration enzyme family protein [Paenibacillus montanisoli]|uniref:trans-sulfuration enzyme family protein n=1 Tax=Paenibacillus montanisoli TaxID=2081970 RepID=UPI001F0B98F3|nr:PLP-dependent aspartate aminotransferase family protein [Paenibacillus montanisoli]
MQSSSRDSLKKSTEAVHEEHDAKHYGAVKMPIYQNSLFTYSSYKQFISAMGGQPDTYIYSRVNNPTVNVLEQMLAKLEGGEQARCFTSGMAAISTAILSTVKTGDHVICIDHAYSPAKHFLNSYLKRFEIENTFVSGTSITDIELAIRENTSLLYMETPTSYFHELQDLQACASLAKRAGIITIVDNTWATPMFQNPLKYGIDMVVHSTTKYISGHSDALGGAVIGSKEMIQKLEYTSLGSIMTPQIADLTMRGVRTLPVRMKTHQDTANKLAHFLQSVPHVRTVYYPGLPSHPQHELALRQMQGFSSLVSFETDLSIDLMQEWADSLRLFRIGVSWGGYESLVTVLSMPESSGSLVRLYLGLEDPEDIISDLTTAFNKLILRDR